MWICKSGVEVQGRGGFMCCAYPWGLLGFYHGVEWCERMWGVRMKPREINGMV
ncbi:hypothetical protein [Bartonella grahamii]|uniref:hypothetical protein n=1 Tax=Bartonella grahamii TaxID=33045 RepID=UPI002E7C1E15|nr:hypothetical protein [Bartonella grahamii]